jgi:hypothetical protein
MLEALGATVEAAPSAEFGPRLALRTVAESRRLLELTQRIG